MGGLSIWHWLIVLLVIVLVFGTKKLRNVGEDLGGAVKGFKKGMQDAEDEPRVIPHESAVDDTKVVDVKTKEKSE